MSEGSERQSERRSRRGWVIGGLIAVGVILVFLYGAASFVVYDGVGKAPQACWPNDQDAHTGGVQGAGRRRSGDRRRIRDAGLRGGPLRLARPADPRRGAGGVVGPGRRHARGDRRRTGGGPGRTASSPAVARRTVLLAAGMLHKAGYSVFLMDLRDHGDSGGDDARFAGGSEEYMDVLGGWDWVRAQGVPAERIGVAGFSFGSISSIVAGAQEPQVAAVWADSPTTTMAEGIGNFLADQLKDGSGLSKVLVPGAVAVGALIAGDDLVKFDPIKEVERYAGRDIAFVHGGSDAVLPSQMSRGSPGGRSGRWRDLARGMDRARRDAHAGDLHGPRRVPGPPGGVLRPGARAALGRAVSPGSGDRARPRPRLSASALADSHTRARWELFRRQPPYARQAGATGPEPGRTPRKCPPVGASAGRRAGTSDSARLVGASAPRGGPPRSAPRRGASVP